MVYSFYSIVLLRNHRNILSFSSLMTDAVRYTCKRMYLYIDFALDYIKKYERVRQ